MDTPIKMTRKIHLNEYEINWLDKLLDKQELSNVIIRIKRKFKNAFYNAKYKSKFKLNPENHEEVYNNINKHLK